MSAQAATDPGVPASPTGLAPAGFPVEWTVYPSGSGGTSSAARRLASAPDRAAEPAPALVAPAAAWPCDSGLISDLLVRCGGGDRGALARLFDVLAPEILRRLAATVDGRRIEESCRAVFVDLWRTAPAYHPEVTTSVAWVMARMTSATAEPAIS